MPQQAGRDSLVRTRTTFLAALCAVGLLLAGSGQAAAGSITSPSGTPQHPFQVPADSRDNPVAFTITGSGWSLGEPVYIEQCDSLPPTAQGWDPTIDCDTGTSPAAALGDAHGNVSFSATTRNYAFPVFRGASPSGLFNCLSPHQPDPKNGLQSFRTCQIRMSSNNTVSIPDQSFITITLPDSSHGYPATSQASPPGAGSGSGASGSNSSGSNGAGSGGAGSSGADSASAAAHSGSKSSGGFLASTGADILLGILLGLLLIAVGWLLARRRRQERMA
jgi:LPXTG-motif cell wall-anchored protein